MQKKDHKKLQERLGHMLENPATYPTGDLSHVVADVLQKKDSIIQCTDAYPTPFYVYDQKALDNSIDSFLAAFATHIKDFKAYYALKLNHHPSIIKRVVEKGVHLEVASKREINLALEAGCADILYFAPGKTLADLEYALTHADVITVNMDSFHEIRTLGELAGVKGVGVRVGIRIHTDLSGDWKKYGIHIRDLKKAWDLAKTYKNLSLEGIHFHMSRNKNANFYENTLKEVAEYLKTNFTQDERDEISYIDFGGGFETHKTEGFFPKTTPEGVVERTLNNYAGEETYFEAPYHILESMTLDEYAQKIGNVIDTYLRPLIHATYISEPGRIICNNAMHIVMSVVDVKDPQNVILDGGVNMVGWQRFEYEYFPLVNITHPGSNELVCNMWGNLCTTWDIWGYRCYAENLQEGDIIVVPYQGALTYSLAQTFIQPIPPVYTLEELR